MDPRLVAAVLACLVVCAAAASSDTTLRQVIVTERHGDRTPTSPLPVDPIEWACQATHLDYPEADGGFAGAVPTPGRLYRIVYVDDREALPLGNCSAGQLTTIGQGQQLSLGAAMRTAYVDTGFLPSTYDASKVYVRASDVPRCMMSAEEFMLGMYPVAAGTASATVDLIDIHTIDGGEDPMSINPSLCPRALELTIENLLANDTVGLELLDIIAPVSTEILEAFHTDDPLDGMFYYDALNCRFHHNLTLPPPITAKTMAVLEQAYNKVGEILFPSTAFSIGPFVETILGQMEDAMAGTAGTPLFNLYSGHDTSVGPLLAALDAFPNVWPPYASHVIFELHQNATTSDFYVKTIYDGDVLTLPGCGVEMCPFATFKTVAMKTVPTDFHKACQLQVPFGSGRAARRRLADLDFLADVLFPR